MHVSAIRRTIGKKRGFTEEQYKQFLAFPPDSRGQRVRKGSAQNPGLLAAARYQGSHKCDSFCRLIGCLAADTVRASMLALGDLAHDLQIGSAVTLALSASELLRSAQALSSQAIGAWFDAYSVADAWAHQTREETSRTRDQIVRSVLLLNPPCTCCCASR